MYYIEQFVRNSIIGATHIPVPPILILKIIVLTVVSIKQKLAGPHQPQLFYILQKKYEHSLQYVKILKRNHNYLI